MDWELEAIQTDGCSLRDHLQKHFEDTGEMPEQLKGNNHRPEAVYVFEWFSELNIRRSVVDGSPQSISYSDLEAWARTKGVHLTKFEFDCLNNLELEFKKYIRVMRNKLEA